MIEWQRVGAKVLYPFYVSTMREIFLIVGGYFFLKNFSSGLGNVVDRNLKIGRPGIAFKGLTWTGVNTELILPITNTTKLSIPIDAVEGGVYYKGQQVGSFSTAKAFTIAANTTTKARINVPLNVSDASRLIQLAIDGLSLKMDVRGIVQSKGVNFPFSFTISPK